MFFLSIKSCSLLLSVSCVTGSREREKRKTLRDSRFPLQRALLAFPLFLARAWARRLLSINVNGNQVSWMESGDKWNSINSSVNIILRNFRILHEDSTTANIFNKPPLKAFRRAKNLKDLLVRSSLPQNPSNLPPGTFPCNRTVCRTCPHVNLSLTITTPKMQVNVTGHYSCSHGQRGLLFDMYQMSIDSLYQGDWS